MTLELVVKPPHLDGCFMMLPHNLVVLQWPSRFWQVADDLGHALMQALWSMA